MDIKNWLRSYRSYSPCVNGSGYQYFYDPEQEGVDEVYYADIHEGRNLDYIEVPYCTFSDYGHGTLERSNQRVFMEKFGDRLVNGKRGVWALYGGYSTKGVFIRKELYEQDEEVKELIDGLDDYPLFDDEDLSNLEYEIEDESWDSWIKRDLQNALEEIDVVYEDTEDDNQKMRRDFYSALERANEEVIFEDAVSCYVDIDKVVKHWVVSDKDNS